jgi:hypothetical protein
MQMTTYQTQSSFAEISNGEPLSESTLAYFRERQRGRIHELVMTEFLKSGMTKADFARRIGRDPAQITRWFANPGNWELDTISDFLIGISGGEFAPQVSYPAEGKIQAQHAPEWLTSNSEGSEPVSNSKQPVVDDFNAAYNRFLEAAVSAGQGQSAQTSANDNEQRGSESTIYQQVNPMAALRHAGAF